MIHFDLPKEQSSIIKVIGVGGGGSNAVNHMFNQSIDGVNFIICNTDAQAIATSSVNNKIQLGCVARSRFVPTFVSRCLCGEKEVWPSRIGNNEMILKRLN